MPKLVNRAKMTTATTGTGTLTLGSAVDGYQTFANAGVANSNVVRYTIEDGSAWEIGLGTYSSTGTTLTRGTIESSTGTAINLSGNATVFVTAAAGDLQELVTFAETFALPTADGTNGQVLTTNGSGTLTFSTISGYTNADVDAHLNTGTAASGEVLSWNGSDYDWVAAPAALTGQTDSASPFETSLGVGAGAVSTGVNNTFVGFEAGNDVTTGNNNAVLGFRALDAATTGIGNVAVGSQAGRAITTGSNNVALGNGALDAATTGGRNIAIGQDAMGLGVATQASGDNIAIGFQAGYDLTSGRYNFFAGGLAGENLTTGNSNIAIGYTALDANTTGSGNIALGNTALGASSTGSNNIALGQDAMGIGNVTGIYNISLGYQSGYALTSGSNNFLGGLRAGENLTTGSNNVALGNGALDAATTGGTNIAIGQNAMGAGVATAASGNNVGIGVTALNAITSGTNNTAVGNTAGSTLTTGANNTLLGNGAAATSATVSNEITLGNSSIATLRCQVTTITSLSDARDKTDIQPLNAGLEFVEALNPVSFTWNMRDGGKVGEADTGFIAQDLQMAQEWAGITIPGLVYDVNPDKLEAGYGKLIPVLVQAIKDLSAKVNHLEAQLEAK